MNSPRRGRAEQSRRRAENQIPESGCWVNWACSRAGLLLPSWAPHSRPSQARKEAGEAVHPYNRVLQECSRFPGPARRQKRCRAPSLAPRRAREGGGSDWPDPGTGTEAPLGARPQGRSLEARGGLSLGTRARKPSLLLHSTDPRAHLLMYIWPRFPDE